jgi:hypothetical protein
MKIKHISIILVVILLGILLSGCQKVQNTWENGTFYTDGATSATAGKNYFVFTNSTAVLKLDAAKNNLVSFFPAKASATRQFHSAPEVVDIENGDDPQVIISDYSGLIESVSFKDASSNWKFAKAQGKFISSTVTVGKTVIAANSDGFIYFIHLNKTADNSRWEIESVTSFPQQSASNHSLDASNVATAGLADFWGKKPTSGLDKNAANAFWATPATDGETVYAPNVDHKVYAVDIATGKEKWAAVDLGGSLVADPLLVDGVLYVGTLSSEMYAIDTATGKVMNAWPIKLSGGIWSKPVLKDGKLYCGDNSGMITILDAKTGKTIDTYATKSAILGSGVDIGDLVLFGTADGYIYSVDTSNKVTSWGDKVTGQFHSNLVFDGTYVLVLAQNGDAPFYVFDLEGSQVKIDTSGLK